MLLERERLTDYSQPHGSVMSHDHYTWNRRLPALYSVIRERERPTDYSQSHGSVMSHDHYTWNRRLPALYSVIRERERPTDYSQSHGSVMSHDHYTWNRRLPALYSVIRERETYRLQSVSRISRSSWVTITTPETEDFLHYIVLLEIERPTDYSQSHGSVARRESWSLHLKQETSCII